MDRPGHCPIFEVNCPQDKPLACYHSLAIDTSARPDELLQLKIGDIEIKKTPDGSGRLYASLDIGRHSKKKRSRIVPMINSILYYRDYLQSGADRNAVNPNAFVFVSREYEAKYRNAPISVGCLRANYYSFRDKKIPLLRGQTCLQKTS